MESIHHKLQQVDPGVVWLDRDNRITALNSIAMEALNVRAEQLEGKEILSVHPPGSREKVKWLLEQSNTPNNSLPPVTMMINVPERVLLVKLSKMCGADGIVGSCMMLYDLTEETTHPLPQAKENSSPEPRQRQLRKLPVYKNNQVLLIDLENVGCIKADSHYTKLFTSDGDYFCNLAISDLERRLDENSFIRVHRSHIINLHYARSFEKVDNHQFVVMSLNDGMRVPVSRNNVNTLKQIFGLF